jgi:uncharacterized membrane-anchored protein
MKKPSIILLGILILAQLAVPFSMIRSKEKILRNGELLRFKTRPIDPADPFQGRYVRLGFEEDHIPWPENKETELKYKEPIFAVLEVDEEGFARFTGWSKERPASGMFLKTRYLGIRTEWDRASKTSRYKGLRIDLPFDRYYMDEAKAPRAERLVRDATRTTNCWANVRVLNGKAVIEDVFAEGQSLRVLTAEKE